MNEAIKEVVVNGETYVRKEKPKDKRAVVVIDRGWIFAGDLNEYTDKVVLTDAVWVMKWEGVGFSGMLEEPKSEQVTLRTMPTSVVVPKASIIFTCPVSDDWGS